MSAIQSLRESEEICHNPVGQRSCGDNYTCPYHLGMLMGIRMAESDGAVAQLHQEFLDGLIKELNIEKRTEENWITAGIYRSGATDLRDLLLIASATLNCPTGHLDENNVSYGHETLESGQRIGYGYRNCPKCGALLEREEQ